MITHQSTPMAQHLLIEITPKHIYVICLQPMRFLGRQIASIHNLGFYLWLAREARKHILNDDFADWKNKMVHQMNNRL